MAHQHFRSSFSRSSTFNCEVCGHRTRQTTQDDGSVDYCGPCYELAGIQNSVFDDGVEAFRADGGPAYRDKIVASIAKRGGDLDKVRAAFPKLFEA